MKIITLFIFFIFLTNSLYAQIIAVNDTFFIAEDDSVEVNLLKNDSGNNLKISSINLQTTLGSVSINDGDTIITYITPKGYGGTDSFQYTIVDLSGDSASGEVLIEVMPGLSGDYYTTTLYKFEEEQSDFSFDYSYNENHGINTGTQSAEGVFGNCRYLDGIDDFINMDSARLSLQSSSELTIEYVARAVSDTIVPPGLTNHSCGNGWVLSPQRSGISYGVKTDAANACFWIGGGWQYTSTNPLDTQWHYYAVTYKINDSLRIYKDGILVASQYVSGYFRTTQGNNFTAVIGHDDFSGGFYEGYVDEVRVSSIARTPSGISRTFDLLNQYLNLPTVLLNDEPAVLNGFELYQNYPNPFNPTTKISWQSPVGSWQTLKIYNVQGNEVATIVDEYRPAGSYEINLDASELSSGVYFYRIQAGSYSQVKKMLLIK